MATELPLDEFSQLFARINGMLLSEETVQHAVELLAQAAKTTIPGAIGAGVTVISPAGQQESTGSTDRVVKEADDLQYETGEGPCLSAWASRKLFNVDDVQSDPRWPGWAAAMVGLPVRSVLSTPLVHRDHAVGALKVYAAASHAFTPEAERLVKLFADPAAALLAHVQTKDLPVQLSATIQRAMGSRDTINIAKGVLMARHGVTREEATIRMIHDARHHQTSLLEAAERLIEAGPPGGQAGQHGQ